jgi:hypothetical protein
MFGKKKPVKVYILVSRIVQMPAGNFECQNHGDVVEVSRKEAERMISDGGARWPKPHELETPVEPIDG